MVKFLLKKVYKTITFALLISFLLTNFNILGETKNWGISFPNPGETPTPDETVEYLKEFDSYFIGNTSEKSIYLTFDAGYENGYTEPILDILKKNQVPATFFLVGTYLKKHPDIINRMVNEGHIVGNHTMSHPDMTIHSSEETFYKELSKVEEIYKSITGQEMKKYYRPPYGKYNETNLKIAKNLGYKTIFWSLAYKDYDDKNQPSAEAAFSKLIPRIHNGSIILLHNTSKTNSLILDELIGKYRDMGFEFKSLDDLLN